MGPKVREISFVKHHKKDINEGLNHRLSISIFCPFLCKRGYSLSVSLVLFFFFKSISFNVQKHIFSYRKKGLQIPQTWFPFNHRNRVPTLSQKIKFVQSLIVNSLVSMVSLVILKFDTCLFNSCLYLFAQ
jgi:hypothetical protein